MKYLAKYMHDVTTQVTDCEACLLTAFEYGLKAMKRRLTLNGVALDPTHSVEKLLHYLSTPVIYISGQGKAP